MPICAHCSREYEGADAAFCPYCGQPVARATENAEVERLLEKAAREPDPKRRHELLLEAEKLAPQSLRVAEELLCLGRLYERNGRALDYSVIKCYLLDMYLEEHTAQECDAMREELFHHPQLQRCLALCDHEDAFWRRYLARLSEEYVELFLRGSARYMRRWFGVTLEHNAPKYLAQPAAKMIKAMRADAALTPAQRALLADSFYAGFARAMKGDTAALDALLAKEDE